MKYIRLLIEYNGTNYQGWQTQRSGLTIQDTIRGTISGIIGEKTEIVSASRTDAGVHALGQVAVFMTSSLLPPDILQRAFNARLPKDIRILKAEELPFEFHPRYRAIKKSYFYVIEIARKQSVFSHPYAWGMPLHLDVGAMNRAAELLLGRHDYSAFRGSGCGAKTTIRTIYSISIAGSDRLEFMTAGIQGDFIKIRIEADAFLRHMVRNIVGTLVEVGKGRKSSEEVAAILSSCDRKTAGPTAPAKGLFLEKVFY